MDDGWINCTVDDIKAPVPNAMSTGPFGSAISSRFFVDTGVPVIRGSNLSQDVGIRLIDDGLVFLTEEKSREFKRSIAKRGDLIFTCWGTIDQVGLIDHRARFPEYVISNKQMKLTPNPRKADSLFLYYLFSNPLMRESILNQGIGSSVPGFNLGQLRAISLKLPPLSRQHAIAHILGTLDDKIELNRRMNETLETIARTIFKSWFVDFDPVRSEAERGDPGLPKHIADLFPDRFEDSELGEIPAGWEIGSILKQAKLLSGGTPKTERKDYWDGDILWASAKDVSQCGETFLITTERSITHKGLDESATQLIPRFCSVVVARGATTGRMVMIGREMAMNQTCYALGSTVDTPFSLYCCIQHEMDHLVHAAHGSVFDTITTSTFANSKIVLPPISLLKVFDQRVTPMFHRILGNIEESQTLGALRDSLLPKLISGQVRLNDVVKLSEASL